MKIFCMDIRTLVPAMRELGHDVLAVVPEHGGLFNLPEFLRDNDFKPDLIVQGEHLGPRRQIEGLDEFACPRIFWAVDSHLNLYWHKYYARLFDAVLTPHLSMWNALPAAERHPLVRQMARQGVPLPWVPHAGRPYGLAFVGVQNQHRPLRAWLCELVGERWPLETRQNISFSEMLELYQQARIVPNEAIAFEINYRMMEAASAGAVVVTPDVGADQNSLFEPGWEICVYRNACDLMEKVEELLAEPKQAESLAYAAWERIQKDHLPVNRAKQIVSLAESIRQGREPEEHDGASRRFYFDSSLWLARVQGMRGGVGGFSGPNTGNAAAPKTVPPGGGQTGETLNLSIRMLLETGKSKCLLPLVKEIYELELYPENIELLAAASFGAWELDDRKLACRLLERAASGLCASFGGDPVSGGEFCLFWAEVLIKKELKTRSGFLFDPRLHLPAVALEALVFAEARFRGEFCEERLLELVNEALREDNAYAYFLLGYLARASLHTPSRWDIQLEYGLQSLFCYRLRQGLFEIREALLKAEEAGELDGFMRRLDSCGMSSVIVRALDMEYIYG